MNDKLYPMVGVGGVIALWQGIHMSGVVPAFALPGPWTVWQALIASLPELAIHAKVSLSEAGLGLFFAVVLAFVCAMVMDAFVPLGKMLYPLLVATQTVPVVAVAPLLTLWFGYGMMPKVLLIVAVCFFPLVVGLIDAFASLDDDVLTLFHAMGARPLQILIHAKLPSAMPAFFSGLKIAVAYAVVGSVIAEWLGGNQGLGVYMIRARKSYAFDKMFAVIFLISAISLAGIWLVGWLEKKAMPWQNIK